jgi:outer membrane immunogenic protein
MKKLLLGTIGLFAAGTTTLPAVAADLPARTYTKAPAYAAPTYSWTGCYIGIEGGGNWGRTSSTEVAGPDPAAAGLPITGNYNLSGGLAGGTVGCNYQVSNWVFGIENDFSWTNTSGTANDLAPFNTASTNLVSEKWLDTLRGRVGITWDRALFYGTGGAAFANTSVNVCSTLCVGDSKTRTGWVAGAGVEYAVWQNISLKLEYLHADFGSENYVNPPVFIAGFGTVDTRSIHLTDDIVRAGLNWQFTGPVIAKY